MAAGVAQHKGPVLAPRCSGRAFQMTRWLNCFSIFFTEVERGQASMCQPLRQRLLPCAALGACACSVLTMAYLQKSHPRGYTYRDKERDDNVHSSTESSEHVLCSILAISWWDKEDRCRPLEPSGARAAVSFCLVPKKAVRED